ncbi:MAG: hypothetical protein QXE18_06825 [Thermoplasmata archaeon]
MIATALTAASVAAVEVTGSILPYDQGGNPKSVFFTGTRVCFSLEYKLDGYNAGNTWFYVELVDIAGNQVDNGVNIWKPVTDYTSWPGVGFDIPWWQDPGTYYLRAWFVNTSELMFTSTVKIIREGIVLIPDQPVYAPGQSVKIEVTVNYNDKINVTVEDEDGKIFQKWSDQSLSNYMWNGTWAIPGDAPTEQYTIWVNRSDNNVSLLHTHIQVAYFTFDIYMDKNAYLPGETAVASWVARSVPDMNPINVAVDFNMSYRDAYNGKWMWQNGTFTTNPFSVLLPANANVLEDILAYVKAYTTRNQTLLLGVWILLEGLEANIWTDSGTYSPGEDMLVYVSTYTDGNNAPVKDANVSVAVYDEKMNLISGMSLENLKTDLAGYTSGIITIPADIEPGDITLVATAKKLAYRATDAITVTVGDLWNVDVIVPKTFYVSGENIDVKVNVWKNGVAVFPDAIEYWLEIGAGLSYPHYIASNASFTIVAPSGIDSNAWVGVRVVCDDDLITEYSTTFWITPLAMELGFNKAYYYAGDTLTFRLDVFGDPAPFSFSYSIWDENSVTVASGPLTVDATKGVATFSLNVPKDRPSSYYTARAVADNHAGLVLSDAATVYWIGDYILNVWVKTGPAYASGGFAPGQAITVGFEIKKSSVDLPDINPVWATISLHEGQPQYVSNWWWSSWTYGPTVATGESRAFEGMSGELTMILPNEVSSGKYTLVVSVQGYEDWEVITVNADGNGWDSSVGGLSAADLMMTILMIVVILMLLWMMIKGGAAAPLGAKKPETPKEAPPKQEQYSPKSTVKCPACGGPIEVATSKRPIEVMCPKCGTSQIIN